MDCYNILRKRRIESNPNESWANQRKQTNSNQVVETRLLMIKDYFQLFPTQLALNDLWEQK